MISDSRMFAALATPSKATFFTRSEWLAFIRVLRYEQLLGRFSYFFSEHKADIKDEALREYVRTQLDNALILAERQKYSVLYECAELKKQLAPTKTPMIFLKGAAYTLGDYLVAKGRTFGDIDLLVPKEKIAVCEKSLRVYGWLSKDIDDYDEKYYRAWAHEIPPLSHAGRHTVLDLHHNIIPPISGRAPDISLLTQHSVATLSGDILSRPAMTLHSIIHLVTNEDLTHGFRDITDIYLLFEEFSSEVFWADITRLAKSTGFTSELKLAVALVHALFEKRYVDANHELLSLSVSESFWLYIYRYALGPKHSLTINTGKRACIMLTYLKGHSTKMPALTLIRHACVKGWRQMMKSLFGKSFYSEDESLTK